MMLNNFSSYLISAIVVLVALGANVEPKSINKPQVKQLKETLLSMASGDAATSTQYVAVEQEPAGVRYLVRAAPSPPAEQYAAAPDRYLESNNHQQAVEYVPVEATGQPQYQVQYVAAQQQASGSVEEAAHIRPQEVYYVQQEQASTSMPMQHQHDKDCQHKQHVELVYTNNKGGADEHHPASPEYEAEVVYVNRNNQQAASERQQAPANNEPQQYANVAESIVKSSGLPATILAEVPVRDLPKDVLHKLKRDFGVKVVATRERPGANLLINCEEYANQENSICAKLHPPTTIKYAPTIVNAYHPAPSMTVVAEEHHHHHHAEVRPATIEESNEHPHIPVSPPHEPTIEHVEHEHEHHYEPEVTRVEEAEHEHEHTYEQEPPRGSYITRNGETRVAAPYVPEVAEEPQHHHHHHIQHNQEEAPQHGEPEEEQHYHHHHHHHHQEPTNQNDGSRYASEPSQSNKYTKESGHMKNNSEADGRKTVATSNSAPNNEEQHQEQQQQHQEQEQQQQQQQQHEQQHQQQHEQQQQHQHQQQQQNQQQHHHSRSDATKTEAQDGSFDAQASTSYRTSQH